MSSQTTTDLTPMAAEPPARLNAVERLLSLCTTIRAGEGAAALLFFGYAFMLLCCYYVLRTLREPLLLASGSAELKSYANAVIAAVLVVLVPLYGVLFRRTDRRELVRKVTWLFAGCLTLFYALGRAGVDVGFGYYVWVGLFSVLMLTQFWAHAAHTFKVESGQRLFPVIMAGAAVGGLVGPRLAGALYETLGAWNLMLVAAAMLAATVPLVEATWRAVPDGSRNGHTAEQEPAAQARLFGGFALVMKDRYLQLLAALAVLLSGVGAIGEFVLTELVVRNAERQMILDPGLDKDALIAGFYGDYYFATNALGLVLQLLVVARVFRSVGMQGALLVLPAIALIGYGLILVAPVFAIIRAVKVLENSMNYTLMNTARHMLYLPLPAAHQYEGKTVIDAFFYRCGDLLQAGVIFVGLNWLGFGLEEFAALNMVLAAVWLVIAGRIGARYPSERTVRVPAFGWRAVAVGACSAAFAVATLAVPRHAAAQEPALFAADAPLELELAIDLDALCRGDGRRDCADTPAELAFVASDGTRRTVEVAARARGLWRNKSGNCSVPPLFVFFRGETAGTPFDGQTMLPLTTHCRERPDDYEQYVLKEYLAYRIFNALTDWSLRVRLARITYRDTGRRRERVVERFAFFTEHFDSLAARHGATVDEGRNVNPADGDPQELATVELFQYLIGNTDWSLVAGHNVARFRDPSGKLYAVPYDFDFSGLVNASYAGPPPELPIRSVTQRLYRGLCHDGLDWDALFAAFRERRAAIESLPAEIPGLAEIHRERARSFLARFFATLDSPDERQRRIVQVCRAAGRN